MGMIGIAEMRETREERRQYEEDAARRARDEERERTRIREANRIRDLRLLNITAQIVTGIATETNINYILSELYAWKELLLTSDASQVRSVINNLPLFPSKMVAVVRSILPILELKAFTFTGGLVQRSELRTLLSHAQNSVNSNVLFVTKLSVFVDKIDNESLNDKQTLCLQRIVNDYQIGLLGNFNSINNIVSARLMTSTTLSQLNSEHEITQGLDITVDNFSVYRDILKQRIASLPLNKENRTTINEVILPGVATIIDDEQTIVDHVREHHGTLYYLNDLLPLHTDHTSSTDPEEYRQVLRRLLINFFGAAEIAHNKGRLNLFCEKICSGYCFEGRVMDTFAWVTTLSDVVSFHETMEKYFQKEYLPYAEIMTDRPNGEVVDVVLADPITNFIMARHNNAECLYDATYAPNGKFTRAGLNKYLMNIFNLVSQRDCEQALSKTQRLHRSLERGSIFSWSDASKILKKIKIDALKEMEKRIRTGDELPELIAKDIKKQYPMASNGLFSRTKKLLIQLEIGADTKLTK